MTDQRTQLRPLHPLLALVTAALASAPVSAQCLQWQTGFARPYIQDTVHALAAYDDGSGPALYVGGQFGSVGTPPHFPRIARWNGTSWASVGSGFNGTVLALHVSNISGDDQLYAGGEFYPGNNPPYLARWNGTAWLPLGTGVNGVVKAITTHDDGNGPALFVGGQFFMAGGNSAGRIARWDGSAWSALGKGLEGGEVLTLVEHDDGSGPALYAGGTFTLADGQPAAHVARWKNGAWSALGSGTDDVVNALASFGGVLVAGGDFTLAGGTPAGHIAAWNGSTWSALGQAADARVRSLRAHDDGSGTKLFAGGEFSTIGGIDALGAARWDGASWSSTHDGLTGAVRALQPFDDGSGTKLFAAGNCAFGAGGPVLNVLRWDGAQWSAISHGLILAATSIEIFDDGSGAAMYAGSSLNGFAEPDIHGIARWSGDAWTGIGNVHGGVSTLRTFDDGGGNALYVGGSFDTVSDGLLASNVAKWDGATWHALGAGLPGAINDLESLGSGAGAQIYAAGTFTDFVARWDGSAWVALPGLIKIAAFPGAQPFGKVDALAVFDAGSGPQLFAGGHFGVTSDGSYSIARWDGTQWLGIGSVTHPGFNVGDIYGLATFDDGTGAALYAVGRFKNIGGAAIADLARWNGTSWSGIAGYPFANSGATWALGVADLGDGAGTRLLVLPNGGLLSSWNGRAWESMAQLGANGNIEVRTLHRPNAAAPQLWIGGGFYSVDGVNSQGVAIAELCPRTGRLVCTGDGSGTACPCGNSSSPDEQAGCANSKGLGGALRASGGASLGVDSLTLDASALPNTATALLLQGTSLTAGGAGVVFGDGLLCVGGTIRRLSVRAAQDGTVSFGPAAGDPALHVLGSIPYAGVLRDYQVWYRNADAYCTPSTFNVTNAIELVWEL